MSKQQKLRMTRQRRIILEELRKVHTHPSADKIYEMVKKHLARISLGTVYRNLEILCQLGEIQQLETNGSPKRFDGNAKNHHHLRCIRCNRLDDARTHPDENLGHCLKDSDGYEILDYRLEFIGICPACLNAPHP